MKLLWEEGIGETRRRKDEKGMKESGVTKRR